MRNSRICKRDKGQGFMQVDCGCENMLTHKTAKPDSYMGVNGLKLIIIKRATINYSSLARIEVYVSDPDSNSATKLDQQQIRENTQK